MPRVSQGLDGAQGPRGSLWEKAGVGLRAPLGGPAHPRAAPQVYKGYVDDPRNTDNAWIETVAVSIHFPDQSDMDLKRLNSVGGSGTGSQEVGRRGGVSMLWGSRRFPGAQSWLRPERGSCREQGLQEERAGRSQSRTS